MRHGGFNSAPADFQKQIGTTHLSHQRLRQIHPVCWNCGCTVKLYLRHISKSCMASHTRKCTASVPTKVYSQAPVRLNNLYTIFHLLKKSASVVISSDAELVQDVPRRTRNHVWVLRCLKRYTFSSCTWHTRDHADPP